MLLAGAILFILTGWPLFPPPPVPRPVPDQVAHYRALYGDICLRVVRDTTLYAEGWDTLTQSRFWQKIMRMGPDTTLVNRAKTRQTLAYLPSARLRAMSAKAKRTYEDSLRTVHGWDRREEIFFTHGRRHFYQFREVLPDIDRAVRIFQEAGVDPWYAQAILLIESPGRLAYSTDGAYGPFQLMEGVAREMGLVVSDSLDERADLVAAAGGAARLLERVCLPETRALLRHHGLDYQESDIWFRLMVLHVYHAGTGNVRRAMRKADPDTGGISLLQTLWQTKSRRFGNASQNYSQLALAALLELDALLETQGIVCEE
ncbi:MAG: hypothetical protein OHK0039_25410 [Bacteroidia bacterium]